MKCLKKIKVNLEKILSTGAKVEPKPIHEKTWAMEPRGSVSLRILW